MILRVLPTECQGVEVERVDRSIGIAVTNQQGSGETVFRASQSQPLVAVRVVYYSITIQIGARSTNGGIGHQLVNVNPVAELVTVEVAKHGHLKNLRHHDVERRVEKPVDEWVIIKRQNVAGQIREFSACSTERPRN